MLHVQGHVHFLIPCVGWPSASDFLIVICSQLAYVVIDYRPVMSCLERAFVKHPRTSEVRYGAYTCGEREGGRTAEAGSRFAPCMCPASVLESGKVKSQIDRRL